MSDRPYDLEERLLEFAAEIVRLCDSLPRTQAGTHVAGQLIRSGTSPLFNHGEAEAAESPRDFVHKMRICLKELRETQRALRLIERVRFVSNTERLTTLLREVDELVRIFYASIRTASKNIVRESDAEYSPEGRPLP